jgi:hypothetical protein
MGRYIISDHRFFEHSSAKSAQEELSRLRAKHPGREFTIYQVRRIPAGAFVRVGDHDPEPKVMHR